MQMVVYKQELAEAVTLTTMLPGTTTWQQLKRKRFTWETYLATPSKNSGGFPSGEDSQQKTHPLWRMGCNSCCKKTSGNSALASAVGTGLPYLLRYARCLGRRRLNELGSTGSVLVVTALVFIVVFLVVV